MATQETYPARLCGPLSFATTISVLGTSEPRNPVMGSDRPAHRLLDVA
jgi:hypothetical protein